MPQTTRLRLQSLSYKVHENRLEKAWIRFENAGFKPILIKGWAAAQFYTKPSDREFNDIDLIIEPERYLEAHKFLETFEANSGIDLHNGARSLDKLSYRELFDRSKIVECGAAQIRVLCAEDHLRVVCVHWLIDGGAKKAKLWDIYYTVANRPADFDWDRCLNAAGKTRRKWIVCAVGLAHQYLGLNLEDTPLAVKSAQIPHWLTKALEKEWNSTVNIKPLHYCLHDGREFWRQIKKRIPPNPIQATVEMEGEFDERPRIFYQIGDVFLRLAPSLKRILGNR